MSAETTSSNKCMAELTALLLDKLEGHEGHHASDDDADIANTGGIKPQQEHQKRNTDVQRK